MYFYLKLTILTMQLVDYNYGPWHIYFLEVQTPGLGLNGEELNILLTRRCLNQMHCLTKHCIILALDWRILWLAACCEIEPLTSHTKDRETNHFTTGNHYQQFEQVIKKCKVIQNIVINEKFKKRPDLSLNYHGYIIIINCSLHNISSHV